MFSILLNLQSWRKSTPYRYPRLHKTALTRSKVLLRRSSSLTRIAQIAPVDKGNLISSQDNPWSLSKHSEASASFLSTVFCPARTRWSGRNESDWRASALRTTSLIRERCRRRDRQTPPASFKAAAKLALTNRPQTQKIREREREGGREEKGRERGRRCWYVMINECNFYHTNFRSERRRLQILHYDSSSKSF